MYVAMNRFKVVKEAAKQFEERWLARESYLHELNGFIEFHMLRGPEKADHVLFSSYTLWATKADFEAWTTSEQFKKSHARIESEAPAQKQTLGHPEFEGFEVLQTINAPSRKAA
jgi:Uncharacterized enzyme involved in biosynthesis of extracellular polysaccharides